MNRLTILGLGLTLIYVVGILCILGDRIPKLTSMPLNEIGDFFAGIFGPVAFLWLVLGFLQQGRELQQSTKALELQAKELNASVKQQRELVAVTRSQLEAEKETIETERERKNNAAKPNFIFKYIGGQHSSVKSKFNVNIKNIASTSTHIKISSNVEMESMNPIDIPAWERGQEINLKFVFENGGIPEESTFTIEYTDAQGITGKAEYQITKEQSKNPRFPNLVVTPIPICS